MHVTGKPAAAYSANGTSTDALPDQDEEAAELHELLSQMTDPSVRQPPPLPPSDPAAPCRPLLVHSLLPAVLTGVYKLSKSVTEEA